MMTIKIGDTLPSISLQHKIDDQVETLSSDDLFSGKKVVVFALPGAFTPTCSASHLPGYVVHSDQLFDKGVDRIVCLSVNDAFVMGAWGQNQNAEEILMLADGNGDFTSAIGLELDASGFGMGKRAQRFGMIVEDGTVTYLGVEAPGEIKASSAETMLEQL